MDVNEIKVGDYLYFTEYRRSQTEPPYYNTHNLVLVNELCPEDTEKRLHHYFSTLGLRIPDKYDVENTFSLSRKQFYTEYVAHNIRYATMEEIAWLQTCKWELKACNIGFPKKVYKRILAELMSELTSKLQIYGI
jgi:hypothetical protein